ncbi:hypothetical protein Spirs_3679 [Sediminispirochaeta smaragdinae DSM 11293]|jgi:hypothetical protein|uniref:Uncharacterized protein n=1 Tax=Sediminispirochaeta smaragdinae (strain DSM 11293 / JCM 15392 / SEBR 4228) TaxID=573413 RepID=E1R7R0_SEDSS|nr:hypothetical protein Spirs_3679 [Sediminispirochaeta smaragdinae DSM 11293]
MTYSMAVQVLGKVIDRSHFFLKLFGSSDDMCKENPKREGRKA